MGRTLSFVVVPEWQASGSARAMRLADGAHAIAGDLPSARTALVEVPAEAGDALGSGVERLSTLQDVATRQLEAVAAAPGIPVSIGGDGGVGRTAAAASIADADCALLWLSAHASLGSPGIGRPAPFEGMVLSTLLGDGPSPLAPATPLSPRMLVLAGVRDLAEGQEETVARRGPRLLPAPTDADDAGWPGLVADAVEATGASRVHLHLDLDVHDPADFASTATPEPFGPSATTVLATVRAVLDRLPLAGAAITGFSPATPEDLAGDLAVILRLIGALAAGGAR